MLLWFLALAVLGHRRHRCAQPAVLRRAQPAATAISSSRHTDGARFAVLGAVFLVVTGGEALYADMGHFGRAPIRLAWFAVVLPALVLNYFGQGALVLSDPAEITQPFYELAPTWALYPLVVLATDGHGDRLAGGHLRRVLADPPGRAAAAAAAPEHRAHPRRGDEGRSTSRSSTGC